MNVGGTWGLKWEQGNESLKNTHIDIYINRCRTDKKKNQKKKLSSHSNLSCLFSWAARSNSWIFLVICSVLRMTSSVLGSVGSESISKSSSSGIELPSPSQPLLLSLPLLQNLLSGWKKTQTTNQAPCKNLFFPIELYMKTTLPHWLLGDFLTPSHPSPSHWTCCHSHFLACCFASPILKPGREERTIWERSSITHGKTQQQLWWKYIFFI